jgi:diguanylate cyclase (GGDEF)-like protein
MLTATYDMMLVIVSFLVAMLASYTALQMTERITHASTHAARYWLAGGALAMGIGIWAMHFVGMLAFSLPIALGYDLLLTGVSLVIAIGVSAFALWSVSGADLPLRKLLHGAVWIGAGIASMHYLGMAALLMNPSIQYDGVWLFISIVVAMAAALAALWLAFKLRRNTPHAKMVRLAASSVMGLAIVGMHYTGMKAANFPFDSVCMAAGNGVSPQWLAVVVIVVTLAVLTIALLTAMLDARLESRTAKLAQSLAQANQELKQMVLHDHLTKLPNRTLLEDRVSQAIHKAARTEGHFALMFIDLDGFKTINDSLGHHVGDLLLMEIAERLSGAVRAQDTVARLGGDEFVILADLSSPEDAISVAAKILDTIAQSVWIDKSELRVSASIGIAIYPEDGKDRHDLMVNADAAMYFTKRSGRNGYNFFEPSMNTNAHHQLQLLQDLRQALGRSEFSLYYQPKFSAFDGSILGAEALLRWRHPTKGLIGPAVFIDIAERSGLILPIGEWVLDEACRQMKVWYDMGRVDWKMAVNLSALQFSHSDLADIVKSKLDRYNLPATCLTLEITESTAMQDTEASMEILEKISALGVDISIDDFGTGYSSLLYLKRLPANELKIDRGFIRDLSQGTEDAAIVSAIVALARSLNLRVVAEGVETDTQKDFLAAIGCDVLQGYLMGEPMHPDQFLAARKHIAA